MNQTNGDSKRERVEVFADILGNNPEKGGNSKYEIFNSQDIFGNVEIGIEPGMIIPVRDGINVDLKKQKQILENQKNRKTEKQIQKNKKRISR